MDPMQIWEEFRDKLRKMEVQELSEAHSVLLFKEHKYLILYDVAGHLRSRIPLEEYKQLFEDKWRDRAKSAGWQAQFMYDGHDTKIILDASEEQKV